MQALGFIFVVLKWLFGQRRCLGRFACCVVPLGGISYCNFRVHLAHFIYEARGRRRITWALDNKLQTHMRGYDPVLI